MCLNKSEERTFLGNFEWKLLKPTITALKTSFTQSQEIFMSLLFQLTHKSSEIFLIWERNAFPLQTWEYPPWKYDEYVKLSYWPILIYITSHLFVLKKVETLTNIHTNNTVKANNYTIVSNNYWIFTVSGRLYILFLVSFGDAVFTIWPKPAKFSVDKEYSGTNPVVDQVWISLRYCCRQFPKIEKWTFENIWFSFEWNQLHLV